MIDRDAELINKLVAINGWLNRAMRFYRDKMALLPVNGNRALAEASMAAGDALRMMKEKEIMGDMTKDFDKKEFTCPCGCGQNNIDPQLVAKLQQVRDESGVIMLVNSGYRCSKHNAEVGGKSGSAHTRGKAADIACQDSHRRYLLLKAGLKYFNRIEVGSVWLHLDCDETLPQEVVFLS